ncbi:MAG TPA: Spy/CpxP family protein refolding chaperone [Longimicrobiales bacterium]
MARFRTMAATMLLAATAIAGGGWVGVLGPTEAAAQTPRARQERPVHPDGRFGPGLLNLAEQLELTEEQKAQIEKIRAELQEKNRPLMEQVRAIVGEPDSAAQRGERARRGPRMQRLTPEQREQVRPLFEQMRENQRAAHEQVMALLTPEQKEKLEKLRAEQAERWRERGLRGERGPGRRDGGAKQQRS